MEKTITLEMTNDEAAQLSALIEMCIARMDEAHEQMAKDQVEIERLRAGTRANLAALAELQKGGFNVERFFRPDTAGAPAY